MNIAQLIAEFIADLYTKVLDLVEPNWIHSKKINTLSTEMTVNGMANRNCLFDTFVQYASSRGITNIFNYLHKTSSIRGSKTKVKQILDGLITGGFWIGLDVIKNNEIEEVRKVILKRVVQQLSVSISSGDLTIDSLLSQLQLTMTKNQTLKNRVLEQNQEKEELEQKIIQMTQQMNLMYQQIQSQSQSQSIEKKTSEEWS